MAIPFVEALFGVEKAVSGVVDGAGRGGHSRDYLLDAYFLPLI